MISLSGQRPWGRIARLLWPVDVLYMIGFTVLAVAFGLPLLLVINVIWLSFAVAFLRASRRQTPAVSLAARQVTIEQPPSLLVPASVKAVPVSDLDRFEVAETIFGPRLVLVGKDGRIRARVPLAAGRIGFDPVPLEEAGVAASSSPI